MWLDSQKKMPPADIVATAPKDSVAIAQLAWQAQQPTKYVAVEYQSPKNENWIDALKLLNSSIKLWTSLVSSLFSLNLLRHHPAAP